MRALFNFVFSVLNLKFEVLGYSLSLWNVLVFSVLGYLVLRFVFGLFK